MKATSRGERMGRVQPFGRPYGAPCGLDAPHALWERQTRHENEDISGDFQTPDHNINRPEIGPMIGDHFIHGGPLATDR
jgi:hypothetical protein